MNCTWLQIARNNVSIFGKAGTGSVVPLILILVLLQIVKLLLIFFAYSEE